ncbi:PAS domain-containing protein, partial [Streptomyces sp. e14]|uniref:PAS domain-containing protein n=1 Tax=Streptomyces sp. e14 TaxID=645465 RepID=UPI0005BA4ECA
PAARRVAPAVVVVGRDRLVSHWSRGAREMFGVPEEEAIGRPATDLLPVSGALPDEDDEPPDPVRRAYGGLGSAWGLSPDGLRSGPALSLDGLGSGSEFSLDGLGSGPAFSRGGPLSRPAAGRARLTVPGRDRLDVLWWAYPLVGPGRARLLVLAADADGLRGDPADGAAAGVSRAHGARVDRWAVERVVPAFAP